MAYSGNRPEFLQISDPELFVEWMEIMARQPSAWEIYYTDGTVASGTTLAEWAQAPSTEVQVVMWADTQGRIHVIAMLESYRGKTGTWMEDADFDALLEYAPSISRIN